MATLNHNEENTPLDDLIRDELMSETRGIVPRNSDRILMRVLQQAQTEVEQLPPLNPSAESHVQLAERKPEYHPPVSLLHREARQRVLGPSIADQITQYRLVMDMKMWRTLGAVSPSLTISR